MKTKFFTDSPTPMTFVVAASSVKREEILFSNYCIKEGHYIDSGVRHVRSFQNVRVASALRATSAAPTYFDAEMIAGEGCIDGGVVANNPGKIAYNQAKAMKLPVGLMVSIGTGLKSVKVFDESFWSFLKQTIDAVSETERVVEDLTATSKKEKFKYFRLNPEGIEQHVRMDASEKDVINWMENMVKIWISKTNDHFQKVVASILAGAFFVLQKEQLPILVFYCRYKFQKEKELKFRVKIINNTGVHNTRRDEKSFTVKKEERIEFEFDISQYLMAGKNVIKSYVMESDSNIKGKILSLPVEIYCNK